MDLPGPRIFSRLRHWHVAASMCALLLSACGGGGGGGDSAPPSITAAPASQSIRIGDVASFTVTAQGDAPLSYQWQRNGADIANATGPAYSTTITRIADNSSVWAVRVSNAHGSVTSQAATLTVTPVQTGTISLAASAYPLQRKVDAQGRTLRIENGDVLLINPDGSTARTMLARATWAAAGLTNSPEHATLDANGVLYFAETIIFSCSNRCAAAAVIWRYGPDGTLTRFAGDNSQSTTFREGVGTDARFRALQRLRFHPNGDLYAVSENDVIKVSPSGAVRRVESGQHFDWDAAGNVYIGNGASVRDVGLLWSQVLKITPAGDASVMAGSTPGYRDGPGAQALFNEILRFAVDPGGNVYVGTTFEAPVLNQNGFTYNLRRIAPSGEVSTVVGQAALAGPLLGPLPGALCYGNALAWEAGTLYADCGAEVLSIRFSN